MKTILIYSLAIFTFISCKNPNQKVPLEAIENPMNADGTIDTDKLPFMTFESETYDFGKISEGEKIAFSFRFKNTGKSTLIISNASASCGCTVPNWPKNPIAPGDEGQVDVTFDSKGKIGIQNKTITIVANTIPNTKVVYLKGEILPPNN